MEYFINKYVVFKKYNDTVIGANLLNNIVFAIDLEKYKLLEDRKSDLISIKNENPIFFSAMIKLGIIITEIQDIYKNLLLQNRLIVFNDKTYRLTINPTLKCNCSCWYCYETHLKKIMPFHYIKRIEKLIENIANGGIEKLYLDWFGGEPLLCYNNRMIPICKDGFYESGSLINNELCNFNHNKQFANIVELFYDGVYRIMLDSPLLKEKWKFKKDKIITINDSFYYRIIDENIIAELIAHLSDAFNFEIIRNIRNKDRNINPTGFGQGMVYKNFDYTNPIILD